MNTLFGYKVVILKPHQRYTLPEEVIPGVPWPPGFREEINSWSRSTLGTCYTLKPGKVSFLSKDEVLMREDDFYKLKAELRYTNAN